MTMALSQAGLALIKSFEGCCLKAYLDSIGIPTIGYGHIDGVKLGDVITQEQADQFLQDDVESKVKDVNKALAVEVTQAQFDALVSFTFNLGTKKLKKSTLLRRINKGEADDCADEFLRWDRAGGGVVAGLTRRRKAEREMFVGQQA